MCPLLLCVYLMMLVVAVLMVLLMIVVGFVVCARCFYCCLCLVFRLVVLVLVGVVGICCWDYRCSRSLLWLFVFVVDAHGGNGVLARLLVFETCVIELVGVCLRCCCCSCL